MKQKSIEWQWLSLGVEFRTCVIPEQYLLHDKYIDEEIGDFVGRIFGCQIYRYENIHEVFILNIKIHESGTNAAAFVAVSFFFNKCEIETEKPVVAVNNTVQTKEQKDWNWFGI